MLLLHLELGKNYGILTLLNMYVKCIHNAFCIYLLHVMSLFVIQVCGIVSES